MSLLHFNQSPQCDKWLFTGPRSLVAWQHCSDPRLLLAARLPQHKGCREHLAAQGQDSAQHTLGYLKLGAVSSVARLELSSPGLPQVPGAGGGARRGPACLILK